MTSRATFLEAVRIQVARARPGRPVHQGVLAAAPVPGPPGRGAAEILALSARFEEAAVAVGATVHRAVGVTGAAAAVVALARARGARRAVAWSAGALGGLAPVIDELVGAGVVVESCPPGAPDAGARVAFREAAAEADVGVTGADLGVAASGSILLCSGPGRARSVSLLPPVHIALLREALVVPSLTEAAPALVAWSQQAGTIAGANAVLVTGPSRTADIELTLTRGVHGPREVHVVLVSG